MTVKYPALTAVLDQHTVDTGRGLMAGFLVRCQRSRKELGHVWLAGSAWRWRTPDGAHYGERSTQRAAVQVLREAFDLEHGPQRPLPFSGDPTVAEIQEAWRAAPVLRPRPTTTVKPAPTRAAPPTPPPPAVEAPPVKKIVWTTQAPDLRAALDAAFRRSSTDK
jgi:hypothetical protein